MLSRELRLNVDLNEFRLLRDGMGLTDAQAHVTLVQFLGEAVTTFVHNNFGKCQKCRKTFRKNVHNQLICGECRK